MTIVNFYKQLTYILLFTISSSTICTFGQSNHPDSIFNQQVLDINVNTKKLPLDQQLDASTKLYQAAQNDYQKFTAITLLVNLKMRNQELEESLTLSITLDSLAQKSKTLDDVYKVRALDKLGFIYHYMELNTNALRYKKEALDKLKTIMKHSSEDYALLYIGINHSYAEILNQLDQPSDALSAIEEGLRYINQLYQQGKREKRKIDFTYQMYLTTKAQSLYKLNQFEDAKTVSKETLDFINKNQSSTPANTIAVYYDLTRTYLALKSYDSAAIYMNQGLEDALNLNETYLIHFMYKACQEYFSAIGNKKSADSFNDLLIANNRKTETNLKATVDNILQKNHNKITEKDQETKSLVYILSSLGLIIILGAIYFKLKQKRVDKHYNKIIAQLTSNQTLHTHSEVVITAEKRANPEKVIENNIPPIKEEKSETILDIEKESSVTAFSTTEISEEKELEILQSLIQFEENNSFLDSKISIASFASALSTNTKYLTIVLKKHRQKGFTDYINAKRIQYITETLYNNPEIRQYKISHLATLAGFASHSRFTIIFKKETNISPSEFIAKLVAS